MLRYIHLCYIAGLASQDHRRRKRWRKYTIKMEENYHYYHDHSGQRGTAIGLAAGLGGGALLLAIAGIWGVNKASEARQQGLLALNTANGAALGHLAGQINGERASREGWQNLHAPSIKQYVDVQTQAGAGAGAGANALATAEALALLNNQSNGLNSAIGGCNFLRVARYSAPQPCGCDTCND